MASFSSKADGAWQAEGNTTWVENGHPATGDTVSIGAHNITLAQAEACNTIAFSGAGTITGGGFTLTVSGASCDLSGGTISGNLDVTCTETIAAAKFDGSTGNVRTLTVNGATKTVTFGAGVSCTTLTITAGTVDTNSTDNNALTVSGRTRLDGTLICNASTCSFGSGISGSGNWAMNLQGGTFTGGTGAHTFGSITLVTGTFTATTGVSTINSVEANNDSFAKADAATFNHSSGTLTFIRAGAQLFWSGSASISFGTIIVNNASCALGFHTGYGHALTCATLTITAGSFDTNATDNNSLTVSGITSITGTLTCNVSTISLGSGTTSYLGLAVPSGGTFDGGSGTHTMGLINASSGSNITLTSGTTTINGASGNYSLALGTTTTFSHGNGTLAFTYAGTQTWAKDGDGDISFNIVIVNNANCLLRQKATKTNNLTIVTLTITAGTFDTSSTTPTYANLTVTGATSIAGTLTCNASVVQLLGNTNSLSLLSGGVFNGGTSTCTMYTLNCAGTEAHTCTLSSVGTTFTGYYVDHTIALKSNTAWTAGPVTFTRAGTQELFDGSHTAHTFTTITINNASCALRYNAVHGFNLTCTTLTITAGSFNSWDGTTSYDLTVTGDVSVTGTLDGKAGAMSFGSLYVASTGTFTASSVSTAITSESGAGRAIWIENGGVFTHSSGTMTFSYAGTTLIQDTNAVSNNLGAIVLNHASLFFIPNSKAAGYSFTSINIALGTFQTNNGGITPITVSGAVSVSGLFNANQYGTGGAMSFGSLTINAGGTYTATTGTTTVAGNWTNSGTFTHSDGTVTFTGSGLHTIGGTNVFKTLTTASSARVEITGNSSYTTLTVPSGTAAIFTVYGGTANDYRIWIGSTLNKSAITNDFSSTSNVILNQGIFESDETAAATSFWIKSGTTFDINSGTTFTCCNVTPDGIFIVDGTWTCGGASFEAYTLDAPNYLFVSNRLDWNNILEADL